MIEGRIEPLLQFAHPGNDSGVDQRVEITKTANLLAQRIEAPQQLHVLFGEGGNIGVSQDLNQRNLEGRERQRAIKAIAASLSLALNPRMAIEKSGDQVSFVPVDIAGLAAAHKVPE